jgi:hypothetical protein
VDLTGAGSGWIDSDEAGVLRGNGEVNEVHLDAGKSMVYSTNSIASSGGEERWLETRRAEVSFGW